VDSEPGLYFVGLEFLYSLSSIMIHAQERDAQRIANEIDKRSSLAQSPMQRQLEPAVPAGGGRVRE
jgi:hypothetical protein